MTTTRYAIVPVEQIEKDPLLRNNLDYYQSRCHACLDYQILGPSGLCSHCSKTVEGYTLRLCPTCLSSVHKICSRCSKISLEMAPNHGCLPCTDKIWKQREESSYELASCGSCSNKTIVGRAQKVKGLICFNCYASQTYATCDECGFQTIAGRCTCEKS